MVLVKVLPMNRSGVQMCLPTIVPWIAMHTVPPTLVVIGAHVETGDRPIRIGHAN